MTIATIQWCCNTAHLV